jgi:hypothetical protein
MVNRLYIMPYEPGLWSSENLLKYGEPKSSLAIVFKDFVNEAAKAWDIQPRSNDFFLPYSQWAGINLLLLYRTPDYML